MLLRYRLQSGDRVLQQHLADAPGNVRLTRRQGKLLKESVVNVSQVLTLDRTFLTEKAGRLPATSMKEVESGLRLVLSL